MKAWRLIVGIGAVSSLGLACEAILGLPDPNVDPSFGASDGASNPEGASPDGSIVDGPSPPTDAPGGPDSPTTGTCGGKNCFGGDCTSDVCQPVLLLKDTTLSPSYVAVDNSGVYFTSGAKSIYGVDPNHVDAGLTAITTTQTDLASLEVSAGYVYFINAPSPSGGASRCATTGCSQRDDFLTNAAPNTRTVTGLVHDPATSSVYLSYANPKVGGGGIYSCLESGCSNNPMKILPFDNPTILQRGASELFWMDSLTNGVYRCAESACSIGPAPSNGVVNLAADALNVYWITSTKEIYWQTHADVGAGSPIAAGLDTPTTIHVDAGFVYWLDKSASSTAGKIERCPISGGTTPKDCTAGGVQVLAAGIDHAFDFAVGPDSVYYTTGVVGNAVWRVAK